MNQHKNNPFILQSHRVRDSSFNKKKTPVHSNQNDKNDMALTSLEIKSYLSLYLRRMATFD